MEQTIPQSQAQPGHLPLVLQIRLTFIVLNTNKALLIVRQERHHSEGLTLTDAGCNSLAAD